jgi:hypothetical protein
MPRGGAGGEEGAGGPFSLHPLENGQHERILVVVLRRAMVGARVFDPLESGQHGGILFLGEGT